MLNKYCYLNSKLKKDIYILNPDDVAKQEKILNQIAPLNEEKSLSFNRVKFEKLKNKKIEEIKDKNTEENKNFTKVIYDGIANNSNNKKCFICNKELSNEDKIEALPCKYIIFFCSDDCKSHYYKCLCSFLYSMKYTIKILENLNIDNENVKKALKNKMLEFYNKY